VAPLFEPLWLLALPEASSSGLLGAG